MVFDAPTALAMSALISLVLGLVDMVAWAKVQRERALLLWGASNLLFCGGMVFQLLRGSLPLPVVIFLGNGLLFLAVATFAAAVRAFDGRRERLDVVALTTAGGLAALGFCAILNSGVGSRIIIVSSVLAAWSLTAALDLARKQAAPTPFARPFAAGCVGIFALIHIARVGGISVGAVTPEEALMGTPQILLLTLGLALGIGWNFAALLMVFDRLASIDDLTGLANRRACAARANALLEECNLRGRPLSVLLVDLDHFKSVNDRFGHRVGDHVLVRFAQIARRSLRATDLLGRHGGEEFCAVLPGASEEAARAVAERLRLAAARGLAEVDGLPTRVTVAIGVSTCGANLQVLNGIDGLIDAADSALYQAKADGRNRVAVARPAYHPVAASPETGSGTSRSLPA